MSKTVVMRILEHNVSVVADLLEDRAPETCALIWDSLPLEGRLIHGMYSGPELFILLPGSPAVARENQVQRPIPGDIGYWHIPGGIYATEPDETAELVFIYDRGVSIKGSDGSESWVNLFAQMRMQEADEFIDVCKRYLSEGPWTLRIERNV
jgi:hypothetical protein